jgi:hypothetical protein
MWNPEESLLGTHAELESFSHSIQYYVEGAAGDPEAIPPVDAGEDVYYNVRITPQQSNPDTVDFITGNPGIISGFYKGIFNDSLTTRSPDGQLTTITTLGEPEGSVFSKVNRTNVYEVISFKADTTRSRTLTYLAEALDGETVIASKVYTILAQDRNWTPGLIALKELVSYASSK